MSQAMTTPAGWYPDPDGTGGQRYFNGGSWTEHRAPAAGAPPVAAVAPTATKSGPDPKVLIGIGAAVVVLIGVVVAAVILTINTKVGEDSVTHKPAEASASSAPRTQDPDPTETQAAGVGQEVRDGNFSFVIAGVERVDAVTDAEFPEIHKAAQGEYVIVKMTVTNVDHEPQMFFASFNILSDGTKTYRPDDEAWVYLGNTLADVNPGDSIETAVVFDVPKGTDAESIELHGGPFSEGVTVGL
ncbi:MAG: hypothetical protein QOJ37_3506 [Pseudonocardiales bacterium]|nr:hypothetical protein [Pseudonocardiales bacterium]